jgi:hypothetical protein
MLLRKIGKKSIFIDTLQPARCSGDLDMVRHKASKTDVHKLAQEEERRKRFLLSNTYDLATDFPDDYAQIKSLRWIAADGSQSGIPEDDLRFAISEVVYYHRHRYKHPRYFDHIKKSIAEAESAAKSLEKVKHGLLLLDVRHIEALVVALDALCALSGDKVEEVGYLEIVKKVDEAATWLEVCAAALKMATGLTPEKPGRGRPSLPYRMPTLELMNVWKDLTGKAVVVPKGTARDKTGTSEEATQPSTQFIYLCLKMIDPRVSLANAMTSIKKVHAMKLEEKNLTTFIEQMISSYRDQTNEVKGIEERIRLVIEERNALFS